MKRFYIGAAYYPELWDKSEIDKDIAKMKEYGMNCMRVGEFAWSEMEPREGQVSMDFFKYVVDKLYENGIYTVLCTPSCTPPRWVFKKYPDAMRIRSERFVLTRMDVHARVHPCKSHKGIRLENKRIAGQMAKAFANHPGVIGWQIDNEIYPFDYGCYCERCREEFRKYLKNKFGTIENVNKCWGMHRWSLDYSDFSEIEPPSWKAWENPSRNVEWVRFQNSLIYSYIHEQAEAIREYSNAPIGTDLTTGHLLSYNEMNKGLDVVQHNHYNTTEDLYTSTFKFDHYRTMKERPYWITETLLGWNGSLAAENGYRNIGYCYINSLLPIAHGAEMNLYWHFRSHVNGHELGHGAFLNSSGRPNNVSKSVKMITDTLDRCEDLLASTKIKSKIAITYSAEAAKVFNFIPLVEGIDEDISKRFAFHFHSALRHYNVDVIETDKCLDSYDVVISPFLVNTDLDSFRERVKAWVENGGTWIVGPLSDIMNEHTTKHKDSPTPFIEEIGGVYTKYQLPLEDKSLTASWNDGEEIKIALGCDAYELRGAEGLAHYNTEELDSLSAITRNKVGKGQVIVLGTVPDHKALLRLVDKNPILEASSNIDLVERTGKENIIIAMEIEGKDGYIVLDKEYYDVLENKAVFGKLEMKAYTAYILKAI
ncbi:MAG: beta-galactosidase [Clostridia bacterium]|nr:beta-galactosidase [Clostridia bacterium]